MRPENGLFWSQTLKLLKDESVLQQEKHETLH